MTRPLVPAIAFVLATLGPAACTKTSAPASQQQQAQAPPYEPSTPIALPDLSGVAESVQRQIRERDAVLERTLAKADGSRADQAAAYGALGRVLMAAKFSDQAISCFVRAESLEPREERWPYYAGHAYLRKGDRSNAAASFQRALAARPEDVVVLVWLGETYLDDDRLDLAKSAFQRAVRSQPQSAPALFGAGRTALAERAYAEATQYLERALAIDPKATAIHYPLAMAYRGLGDAPKAEAHLAQRGSSYPVLQDPLMEDDERLIESSVSLENRGMQALRSADFATAVASFRKGLELDPEDASLRYWLGAALYASGDVDGAVREFSAVVQRDPDFAKAHFSLGAIYDARNDRPKAMDEFRATIRADPNLPEARVRLAGDLRSSGQPEAAFEQYETAVKLDPSMVEAWIGGAQALLDLRRNERAKQWLAEARRLFPNRRELADLQGRLKE